MQVAVTSLRESGGWPRNYTGLKAARARRSERNSSGMEVILGVLHWGVGLGIFGPGFSDRNSCRAETDGRRRLDVVEFLVLAMSMSRFPWTAVPEKTLWRFAFLSCGQVPDGTVK